MGSFPPEALNSVSQWRNTETRWVLCRNDILAFRRGGPHVGQGHYAINVDRFVRIGLMGRTDGSMLTCILAEELVVVGSIA